METTWLYAWVLVITARLAVAPPGFAAMAVLFVLATWCGRLSSFVPWRYPRGHLLLVPATIAALPVWLHAVLLPSSGWRLADWSTLLSAPSAVVKGVLVATCVLALYLWGRGLWVGVRQASIGTLGKWLAGGAVGFIALFALVAAGHDKGLAPIAGHLELLVLGYFVLGLGVLAIVQTSSLHGDAARGQPISAAWAAALAVPMAAIAALGLLFTGDLAPVVRAILAPVVPSVTRSVAAVTLVLEKVLLWVGSWLLMFWHWLTSLFPVGLQQVVHHGPESLLPPPLLLVRPSHFHPKFTGSAQIDPLFAYALLGLILGSITVGIAFLYLRFLLRRFARARLDAVDEERTSLWSWQLLHDQLQGLRAMLFGRLRQRREALAGWIGTIVAGRAAEPEPADIREVYRRLLRWAAASGHRRLPATTPHELLHQLTAAVPLASAALTLITANYERARYGDLEVTDPDFTASRRASEEIAKGDRHGPGPGPRR